MAALYPDIHDALRQYDPAQDDEALEKAEQERAEILKRFPREAWPELPLEAYALGQPDNLSKNSYCRWLEFGSRHLGGMGGGSAGKHIIYKHKNKPGWYFYPRDAYTDEREAWRAVRSGFLKAFELADAGEWDAIDEITELQAGPMLRVKTLHIYFPSEILPIYSRTHLQHYLGLLRLPEAEDKSYDVVRFNRALLAGLRNIDGLADWSTNRLGHFMYGWADPTQGSRIVKIAPGENAEFWPDCLSNGYICVGWDEIGDLQAFESKKEFRTKFHELYAERYSGHSGAISRGAKELWTLRELEPGDIVIANRGMSEVLAVGKVVEPAYEWLEDRDRYRHTVHVEWDTSVARKIPKQPGWRSTVNLVKPELYALIMEPTVKPPPVPVPSLFADISSALERKGQAILYGPPGTGKTFGARRFATWWLTRNSDRERAGAVLSNSAAFEKAESQLSTAQVGRRVWWVVANPSEWQWTRLFDEGKVEYHYGRLKRNYPLVQPGDLVVGYQSSPDKRIVALARVTRGLSAGAEYELGIELAPLALVANGPTYHEIGADPVLGRSEPMRFRSQGTLFALQPEEAERLLALMSEKDPSVQDYIETEDGIGQLTYLTFHPSYSYEDFVEGFRPVNTGDGKLSLRLEDGVFKRICREAQANPDKPYLIIIDEINRANLAKVFGELITLLEKDKRGMVVTLPQSKESFVVPGNLYILGTMNTADRSIKLLDAALRRRFAFLEVMPDVELLRGATVGDLPLDTFLEELNHRIAKHEGREKQIGHSFLLRDGEPIGNAEEFAECFRQEILPLLQEYCYADYTELARYVGESIVDPEAFTLDAEILTDVDGLLAALKEEFATREREVSA